MVIYKARCLREKRKTLWKLKCRCFTFLSIGSVVFPIQNVTHLYRSILLYSMFVEQIFRRFILIVLLVNDTYYNSLKYLPFFLIIQYIDIFYQKWNNIQIVLFKIFRVVQKNLNLPREDEEEDAWLNFTNSRKGKIRRRKKQKLIIY